jgi:hypothetical protein
LNSTYEVVGHDIINYSSSALKFAPVVRKCFGSCMYRPYLGVVTGWEMNHSKTNSTTEPKVSKSIDFGFYITPEAGISFWLNDKGFLNLNASHVSQMTLKLLI